MRRTIPPAFAMLLLAASSVHAQAPGVDFSARFARTYAGDLMQLTSPSTVISCTGGVAGSLRYNGPATSLELCNGSSYVPLVAGGALSNYVAKAGDTMSGRLYAPDITVGTGADYAGVEIRSHQTGFPYIDFSLNNSEDFRYRILNDRASGGLLFQGADGNYNLTLAQNGNISGRGHLYLGSAQYLNDGNIYMPWLGGWLSSYLNQDVRNGATPTFNTVYTPNWFRSSGNSGWLNETYGGGWYMIDTTWLRAWNNKWIYTGGAIQSDHSIRTPALCDNGGGNCLSPASIKWAHDSINGKVGKAGDTMTGGLVINNSAPSLVMQDTDGFSANLHTNSSYFYILRSANWNAQDWATVNGYWPMQINLGNNDTTFGGNVSLPAGSVSAMGTNNYFRNTIITSADGTYQGDWPGSWGQGLATWDINAASLQYTTLVQRSDIRHKKNIVSLTKTPAVERLMHLRPVQYEWKDTKMGHGPQYGFIAQEVEKIWPELITTADNVSQTKAMNYTALIAPLVEAVQELNTRNTALQAQNDALRADMAALKAALTAFNNQP